MLIVLFLYLYYDLCIRILIFKEEKMTLKKSLMSALLASFTLVSVVACNSQVQDVAPVQDNVAQTNDVNAMSVDQIKAKYKLNYNVNSKKNSILGLGNPTNALSKKAVDLRADFQQVYDQGQLGSCTAFSMVKGLREYLAKKDGDNTQLSALEFYYKEREADGDVTGDNGSQMDTGMNVLKDHGVALDSDWPYDVAKFAVEPPAAVQAKAGKYKVASITQLKTLSDVKAALDAGKPVSFGTKVPGSFMKPVAGVIADPKAGEQILGGHAVLVVGYDDVKKAVIMRNSWSASWGLKGYAYLPYTYWSKGYVMDAWTASTSSKK